MNRIFQGICAALLLAIGTFFTGCTGVAYTEGTVGYYGYDYYPDWDVYYYPERHIYYWDDGQRWRSGRRLPHHFDIHEAPHEHLDLHTRQPWTEHRVERGGGVERRHEQHERGGSERPNERH